MAMGINADQIGGLIRAATPFAVVVASHYGIGEADVTLWAGFRDCPVACRPRDPHARSEESLLQLCA